MTKLIPPAINLLILLGLVFYYAWEPFIAFVHERHDSLRTELERVAAELKDAQAKLAELSRRLMGLDGEIRELHAQAREDAQATHRRTIENASRISEVIILDAKDAVAALYGDLRAQLRTELGERILGRAEGLLRERLTGDDRVRIRREFSLEVEKMGANQ